MTMSERQRQLFVSAVENKKNGRKFDDVAADLNLDTKRFQRMRNEGHIPKGDILPAVLAKLQITQEQWLDAGGQDHESVELGTENDSPDSERYKRNVAGASQIWVSGLSLSRFFPDHRQVLRAILAKEAGAVKAMVLHPKWSLYGAMQEHGRKDERTVSAYNANLREMVLPALSELSEESHRRLEYRVVDFPISVGLDLLDPHDKASVNSAVYVRRYSIRKCIAYSEELAGQQNAPEPQSIEYADQPNLRFKGESRWFDFYRNQYYTLWKHWAEVWKDSNYSSARKGNRRKSAR